MWHLIGTLIHRMQTHRMFTVASDWDLEAFVLHYAQPNNVDLFQSHSTRY